MIDWAVPELAVVLPAGLVVVLIALPLAVAGALAVKMLSVQHRFDELRRAADRDRAEADVARRQAVDGRTRLERALDAIPQAVLIADADGQVVMRNRVAAAFTDARHSDALVEAAIDELLALSLIHISEPTRPY